MNFSLLRPLGALAMCALLSTALGAKPAREYPRLSDNTAASQTLEMRQMLRGPVDGMFVLPRARQLVVAAGAYLWKYSADGQLVDSLHTPGGMARSGVEFKPHYYMDWVYSGNRQPQRYGPAVDGNRWTDAQLHAELDRADHLDFGRNDTSAWAYLLKDGKAWIVDITRHREKVDTSCHQNTRSAAKLSWNATCLAGYTPRQQDWTEIEPDSFYDRHGQQPQRVRVVDFERRRLHLEEGVGGQLLGMTVGVALKALGAPGSLPDRYWFGDAHTELQVGKERLKFTAFIPRRRGDYDFGNLLWWDPSAALEGASPWFTVEPRPYLENSGEAALLRHYEKDIGLYVVRPRSTNAATAGSATVPAWQPVFKGPSTRFAPVSGMVEFMAGAPVPVWLRRPAELPPTYGITRIPPVEPLAPRLDQLPAALTVRWGVASDLDDLAVRIEFARAETQAAFERLRTAKAPIELVLQVPELEGPPSGMSLLLQSGNTQEPLRQARITRLDGSPGPKGAATPSPAAMDDRLRAATESARQSATTGLAAFLQATQAMAQDLRYVEGMASDITHAYAALINHYNKDRNFAASSRLTRHYIAQVYPHTGKYVQDKGQAYNVGVIASQTLAFAMQTHERDLADSVVATLLGKGFDPAVQTNGTLMYNLACYYALTDDRARMLDAITHARRLGKPTSQFLQDTDFDRYKQDAQFLQAVNTTS